MSFVQGFNDLFSPMDKKYCSLFHGISVFHFIIMIIAIINLVFLFLNFKRNKMFILNSVVVVLMFGINYIYNRLLFNMCK